MKSLASRTQPGFRQAPPKWSEQWEAGSSPLKSCWDVFSALSSQRVGTGGTPQKTSPSQTGQQARQACS